MPRRSLIEHLEKFRVRGSDIAYVHRRGYRLSRWTYGDVVDAANQCARELEARGIAKGDRVLLWGENCAEWVVAFFGCMLRGAVVVPLDAISLPAFARRVATHVDAKLLICSGQMGRLNAELPVITFDAFRETLARWPSEPYQGSNIKREDPLEIVFTSGTTSEPRGVVISHANVLANLDPLEKEINKYLRLERFFHPIRFLNLLPLSHIFGQFLGIFVPSLLYGTVIFQDTLNPSEVIRTVKRERVSVLVAVPRLLEALKQKIESDFEIAGGQGDLQERLRFSESEHFIARWWRFRTIHRKFGLKFWAFISGGAALDSKTETFWRQTGFAIIQGYGMTETTSLVSLNHPFRMRHGSIGRPLPGLDLRLDASGEILVRGESISAGYWNRKEPGSVADLTANDDGWFRTGDLGELDAAGNLHFKGRKKDVIVTAEGMKVYPADLEAALRRQAEILDCVVVGLARGANAEPCAVLILREPSGNPNPIIQRANESLAGYQQIRRWIVWPEHDFPRTSTQKPRTQAIQEFISEQLAGPREQRVTVATPSSTLAGLIERVTGRTPEDLKPNANLTTDLNLSSIDRVELLNAIEDRYQIDLDENNFGAATTMAELERMLRQPTISQIKYRYPRWAQRWPITWIRLGVYYLLSWPATLLMGYPRVRGREKLIGIKGPVLIVSNHVTSIDIGFILAALPARLRHRVAVAMIGERLRAMRYPPATSNLFGRGLDRLDYALLVALFNVFPLFQKSGFRESFIFAGESVDRGYNVVVFPEGRRTPDGQMGRFRAGVGMLAAGLNIPVVPIRIDGLWKLKQAGKRVARPHAVTVTIGLPVQFDRSAEPEAIARDLEYRVASLAAPPP